MLRKQRPEFHVIQKQQHVAAELPAASKQKLFSTIHTVNAQSNPRGPGAAFTLVTYSPHQE